MFSYLPTDVRGCLTDGSGPRVYGVFSKWPQDGVEWIAPSDLQAASAVIPSLRVFCKVGQDGPYNIMAYGALRLMLRPALWRTVRFEGFDVGDQIQIRSRMGTNDPFVGVISDMFWSPRNNRIDYHVHRPGRMAPASRGRLYTSCDMMHVQRKCRIRD